MKQKRCMMKPAFLEQALVAGLIEVAKNQPPIRMPCNFADNL